MNLTTLNKSVPFQVFSSAINPAKGKAINGPRKAHNIVLYKDFSETALIYIVLPISKKKAENNIIEYFKINA